MATVTHYDLLGIPADASQREVELAYQRIQEAYWRLSDPTRRAAYDSALGLPLPTRPVRGASHPEAESQVEPSPHRSPTICPRCDGGPYGWMADRVPAGYVCVPSWRGWRERDPLAIVRCRECGKLTSEMPPMTVGSLKEAYKRLHLHYKEQHPEDYREGHAPSTTVFFLVPKPAFCTKCGVVLE